MESKEMYPAIYSGIPWFDQDGKILSAHGGNMIRDKNRYYLFGENHSDTSNAFAGFNCYSSTDLRNWKFESIALPVQNEGKLGPGRIGERAKVMKCPKTGRYVMLMHADTLGYKDQFIGYATADNITGPYHFHGALLFNGKPIRKWDMGIFQDSDGNGYLIIHGGLLYQLSDDYCRITAEVTNNKWTGSESPAIFKRDGIYFWLGSDLTSWERNDNFYYTATSLKGPWTYRGNFAPAGSWTWNSQTTSVFMLTGSAQTTYLFMGDRWSFPYQHSSATYVWQPLTISGTKLSIPQFRQSWTINAATGIVSSVGQKGKIIENTNQQKIIYSGKWEHSEKSAVSISSSDDINASFRISFNGTQIGIYGFSDSGNGYADVVIRNDKGKTVLSCMVDMYARTRNEALHFMSPVLKKGNYVLTVSVTGKQSNWSDKRKSNYGSTGSKVTLDKVVVN